jgi:hypothetical protein
MTKKSRNLIKMISKLRLSRNRMMILTSMDDSEALQDDNCPYYVDDLNIGEAYRVTLSSTNKQVASLSDGTRHVTIQPKVLPNLSWDRSPQTGYCLNESNNSGLFPSERCTGWCGDGWMDGCRRALATMLD